KSMSLTMTIEVPVPFQPVGRCGRKALHPGAEKPALPTGRVPRVARLGAKRVRTRYATSAPCIVVRKASGRLSGISSSPNRLFSKQLDAYTTPQREDRTFSGR